MTRGLLANIGIVKGRPFAPTEKQQALLKKAVETAPKIILATRNSGARTSATSTTRIGNGRTPGPA